MGAMDYLLRMSHSHEDFRLAEIRALAVLNQIDLQIIDYRKDSPFCIIRVSSAEAARRLVSRGILVWGIYELWGAAADYTELRNVVKLSTAHLWPLYKTCSFKFSFDSFQGTRSPAEQVEVVESFSFMEFEGKIKMKNPNEEFCVFEEYDFKAQNPKRVLLGRLLGEGARQDITTYNLKKRRYLSTTSMDAELALIGSNLTLARPGSLFYDPFLGTASLTIACSHHGAVTIGSDLDGRSIRGKFKNNVFTNYAQYGLQKRYLNGFVSDLTNTPLRTGSFSHYRPLFDGIVCDPPYGVREGLKVLGSNDGNKEIKHASDRSLTHLSEGYIPPKRPYSFEAMLDDILDFAALTLVVDGRLSFWMPTANDEEIELGIPMHAALEVVSLCVQPFNKWSRRLITYRRKREDEIDELPAQRSAEKTSGRTANDLNSFRRKYFEGFKTEAELR